MESDEFLLFIPLTTAEQIFLLRRALTIAAKFIIEIQVN